MAGRVQPFLDSLGPEVEDPEEGKQTISLHIYFTFLEFQYSQVIFQLLGTRQCESLGNTAVYCGARCLPKGGLTFGCFYD